MTRLSDRLRKLERTSDEPEHQEVRIYSDDGTGTFRDGSGEPLPTDDELEQRGIFAIKIVAFDPTRTATREGTQAADESGKG